MDPRDREARKEGNPKPQTRTVHEDEDGKKISYEKVDVLIVDGKSHHRSSLRHVLNDPSFCEIRYGTTQAAVPAEFAKRMPDFMIADSNLPDGTVAELITDIRHHKTGANPFLPNIVMTWDPAPELIREIIDAGAHDILLQPTSRNLLKERIDTLTFDRKPFVVSARYIGPNRRSRARNETQTIPLIGVSNTLNARASVQTDLVKIDREIYDMIQEVNEKKLRKNALHIDGKVQKIVPALSENHRDKKIEIHLRDILFTTEDRTRRVINTPYAHISKLCLSLISVVARLKQPASESEIQDVRIMPKLSAAIKIAFEDTESTAETASRISAVIEHRATT